jgi:hypothetical protein
VVSVSGSGYCSRAYRTVRGVLADCPRGVVRPGDLRVRRVFLSALVSIRLASCFWPQGVWQTVRPDVTDCPCVTSCSRTVRGRGTDRPRVEVPVGSFCLCLTDSPPWVANRPHGDRELSARAPAGQLSPLLLASCFYFGVIWGLFLGLVGLLWLRDLGKLVWESVAVNLGYRPSSLLGE